jgi:hypothetical protein
MRTKYFIFALIMSLVLMADCAFAEFWSSCVITGTPHFNNAATNIHSWSSAAHGRGMRMANGTTGYAYIYVPVYTVDNAYFAKLTLRAEDNSANCYVKACLFYQPNCADGPAVQVACVSTSNVTAPADGFQCRSVAFNGITIDYSEFSYYIVITIYRNNANVNPTAYDVSLS